MDVVLIPAYEPDEELVKLVDSLSAEGFAVLVVNDGSGASYDKIFEAVSATAQVLTLEKNSGKGAALKHGMRHIRSLFPDAAHFITCDADGQHRVADVVRVRERLHQDADFVLTVRNRRRGIPLRSKVGNDLSRFVYTVLANHYLSDNQSGLRGFAVKHIDWLVQVEKDNYDYEMNVLYYANKQGMAITTLPIEAIYIGNNESSHFKPVADTIKIYKCLFRSAIGSFVSLLLCEILMAVWSLTLGYEYLLMTLPITGAVYGASNILLNRFLLFKKVSYYDYWNTLAYTGIYYFLYTLGCLVFRYAYPEVPLFWAFNITFVVFIPVRYYLHKLIFIASKTRR